jgi:preprotein translocase subunit SecD
VVSAPQVREDTDPTTGLDAGAAVITVGGEDSPQARAEDLATVLKYGALPTTFETDDAEAVSATLGADSLRAGLIAGIGGLVLVALAMILYYRALGLVTILGLSVFGSMLLLILTFLSETQGLTLTLAGVTGIVVAIGITSDSYIVYFERIKEEVNKGRPLRAAVDSAFPRAFRTILTADAVSAAGAILLWLLAVGPVKGFAVSLGLATVVDVIVAYFFTRNAAAYLVRTRFGDGGAASIRGAVGRPAEARP